MVKSEKVKIEKYLNSYQTKILERIIREKVGKRSAR